MTRNKLGEHIGCGCSCHHMDEIYNKTIDLKPWHIIHTLMEEHKLILEFVGKLGSTTKSLEKAGNFVRAASGIKGLQHIAKHLVEADKHHEREEKVLFPALQKHGIVEPTIVMMGEHEELRARKNALYNAASSHKNMAYSDFVKSIKINSAFIANNLPNHIDKEDNILYPMALRVIGENEWKSMKKKCDKIGYCCFTPKF